MEHLQPSGAPGARALLDALGDGAMLAAVVQALPRASETGEAEARGTAVAQVWHHVTGRVPGARGCRLGWDLLLFLAPADQARELDGALEAALRASSSAAVELRCAMMAVTGTPAEKLKLLDAELMEEFGARRNFGTRPSVHARRVDGRPWQGGG